MHATGNWGNGTKAVTLTGALTLDLDYRHHRLDANGANRDVTLPNSQLGAEVWIWNTAAGAFNLVVKTAAAVTLATLNQNEAACFTHNGTAWILASGIITIAQS